MKTAALFAVLITTLPAIAQAGTEIGVLDAAGDTNGGPNLVRGDTVFVRGWASDTSTGAPVFEVTIYVDGSPLGTATLGGLRPDVAQAYNRSDYTNSGWNFSASTSNLAVGSHTVTAVAHGFSATTSLSGSKTINITSPNGGRQTVGFVDTAGDANGMPVVIRGNTLYVQGWAADNVSGAPVLNVTVFIDGFGVGSATLGVSRPDVAQAFGSVNFLNSGWTFQLSTSILSVGSHVVSASASGPSGTVLLTGSKSVNITQQGGGQEIGFVDFAGATNGSSTSVIQGGTLLVRGWAADTATGAPVQTVSVFIDGVFAGTATLGSARPDVAAANNRSDYTNSGWTFQMSTSSLSLASHSVTASASGSSGTATLAGNKSFTVTNQSASQVIGFLDAADLGTNTITARGWAADLATGAPVQNVLVTVDGIFSVLATLGVPRPDVATALNRPDFTNSGWTATIFFSSPVGSHTFTATATGPSGTAPLSGVKVATFP